MIRDGLYDLDEFVSHQDDTIKSTSVPDLEMQQLAKKMLAPRHSRILMDEVYMIIIRCL